MEVTRTQLNRALNNAGRSAINKILIQGRNIASRKVRDVYNVKAKILKDNTVIRRASNRSLEGQLIIRGRKLPLIAFGARKVRRGTTVRVKKSSGRKLIRHAFIATMPSGKVHVWMRRGPGRLPIDAKFTISPAGMFENEGVKAFEDLMQRKLPATIDHELQYYLERQL